MPVRLSKMNRKSSLIQSENTKCSCDAPHVHKINVCSDKKIEITDKKKNPSKETHDKHTIGDVNITTMPDNILHLGTLITVNGSATFQDLSKSVLMNIKTNCKCKYSEKELTQYIKRKKKYQSTQNEKLGKNRNTILRPWNFKKCLVLGFSITMAEVLGLFFYHIFFCKNSDSYINKNDVKQLNEMNINLKRFIRRPSWGLDDHECTFQCYTPSRSRIKFHIPLWSSWFQCLFRGENCENFIISEFQDHRYKLPVPLNDIYYNYFVSMTGVIYEARPLSCPFDDEKLADDDHSSVIIVGIPYCFPGNGKNNNYYSLNVFQAVKELLQKLQDKRFLDEKYILEFPSICNNSLLVNFTTEMREVSFYELENSFNYSSFSWNPNVMRNLLFLSDEKNKSDIPSVIRRNALNPLISEKNHCINEKNSSKNYFIEYLNNFNAITIKYTNLLQRFNMYCKNETDCFRTVISYSNQEPLKSRSFNYFIYLPKKFVFEFVPLDCSFKENHGNKEIGILIIFPSYSIRPDENIILFSNLLQQLVKDIKERINYKKVSFEIFCDSEFSPIMSIYEVLMNDIYITSKGIRVSTYRECNNFFSG